ncbi:MAG: hypothetical protein NC489_08145 [Ruminococcus flavefaciens]|nr:hypothetical protein [Ruminococcus flavefaciens]
MEKYTISVGPVTSVMELMHALHSIPNHNALNIITGDGSDFVLTVVPDEHVVIISDKEENYNG